MCVTRGAKGAALFRNLSSYLLDHPQLFDQAVLNCFLKKDRTDAYAAYTNCASEKEAGRFFVAPPLLTLLRAAGLCSCVEAGASLALVAPSNNATKRPLMLQFY